MISKNKLEELTSTGMSIREIATDQGVAYSTVRHWLKKYGLKTLNNPSGRRGPTLSDIDRVKSVAKESISISDLLRNLGMSISGSGWRSISKYIDDNNIDTSHFMTRSEMTKHLSFKRRKTLQEYLDTRKSINGQEVRKKLVEEGYSEDKCELCNLPNEWNGQPLTLQLDHIDGNRYNNTIQNFRIICPNCHTQTKTHSGKNRKSK